MNAQTAKPPGDETVVVTGTAVHTDAAPAKSSLETMEPQTIINKSYIEDFVPRRPDYITILSIVPSMTGAILNGPGLSDGGVKNTLRGLPDGNFGINMMAFRSETPMDPSIITIPISLPALLAASTSIAAPAMPAIWGLHLWRLDQYVLRSVGSRCPAPAAVATYGSFNTSEFNANAQTGDMDIGRHERRPALNFQTPNTNGCVDLPGKLGAELPGEESGCNFAPDWTVTAFANYNYLIQHLEDNSGATAAQIKSSARITPCRRTIRAAGTYRAYNTGPQEDRYGLSAASRRSVAWDRLNTFYTYAYVNKTLSPTARCSRRWRRSSPDVSRRQRQAP